LYSLSKPAHGACITLAAMYIWSPPQINWSCRVLGFNRWARVVVVTHGAVIEEICWHADPTSPPVRRKFPNTSISIVHISGSGEWPLGPGEVWRRHRWWWLPRECFCRGWRLCVTVYYLPQIRCSCSCICIPCKHIGYLLPFLRSSNAYALFSNNEPLSSINHYVICGVYIYFLPPQYHI
jgi:hypothetical protein